MPRPRKKKADAIGSGVETLPPLPPSLPDAAGGISGVAVMEAREPHVKFAPGQVKQEMNAAIAKLQNLPSRGGLRARQPKEPDAVGGIGTHPNPGVAWQKGMAAVGGIRKKVVVAKKKKAAAGARRQQKKAAVVKRARAGPKQSA